MSKPNPDKTTTKQVNMNLNPTGKGGFGDNPQNRSNGRWSKEHAISYQYNYLMRLPFDELKDYVPQTVAQKIALERIKTAITTDGFHDTKEITDRTEGKAPQFIATGDKKDYDKMFDELTVDELRKLAS